MKMKPQTLAFDVYGTMINTTGVQRSIEKLIGEKAPLLVEMWRNKQLEYSFRRGLMNNYVDFSQCTREALDFSCETLQIHLTNTQKQGLMDEYRTLPAFADVRTGLEKLQNAEHRLFAFSNGSKKAVTELLVHAEVIQFFDGVVSVENVKMFKPSPLVYAHFNQTTGSTPANSWLISSNPFDVLGAINYGMHSAWVQRSSTSVFDPWGIVPTFKVSNLDELSVHFSTSK